MSLINQYTALVDQIAIQLQQRHQRLVTAESCTGGMISAVLTDKAGSSSWFEGGVVTYSNAMKIKLLAVAPATLEQHGAVSEQVVAEMVRGALVMSKVEVALAVSGIAGPSGGTPGKPVGTVCFAWGHLNRVSSETRYFAGDREAIRHQATFHSLHGLLAVCNGD